VMIREMYNKNIIGLRRNKRAVATSIVSVLLILVAVGVVGYIIYKGISGGGLMIRSIFEKYGPPKINDTTAYLYSIEDMIIANANDAGCSLVADHDNMYNCPAGKSVDFSVSIKNGGTLMRKINGAIVVCKTECKRGKCEPKDCSKDVTDRGSDACYIEVGRIMECSAGSQQFKTGGYIVYSAAICALESTYGCYSPTMLEADKIYNPQKYILIIAS
jgi:hypothetical protein